LPAEFPAGNIEVYRCIDIYRQKGREVKMAQGTSCDTCSNYLYDEDYDCYECDVSMDEDEMARFLSQTRLECPYYRSDNEYEVVKHQM